MVPISVIRVRRLQAALLWLVVLSTVTAPATAAAQPVGDGSAAGESTQAPELELSTDSIEFGRVPVDPSDLEEPFRLVSVTNRGDRPVTIEETTVAGPSAEAFEIIAGGAGTLAPGEVRRMTVAFAPASPGESAADLRIEPAEGPAATVELSGTGVGADIEVRPETIRFENATDGPATGNLTLANAGEAPLTVRALRVLGPDRSAFEPEVSVPFTLDPDESRTVAVTFESTDSAPRFATLHVLSDDPDEPQRNVWLTNTPMVADVSPSTVLADRTIVNVTVENAQANTPQSINVSWPLTRDDAVAIDALTLTPERGLDFTINVTKSTERFEGTPPFNLSDGTRDVAFVTMNSSIAAADLRNVSVVFRVRKDQLAENETGPEDVTLYTRRNGTWTELPTRPIDESPTHYFFEARATGLTDFATGIKQAKFRIEDTVVTITEIRTGEDVDVLVRVTNEGGADGTYMLELIRSDTVVDRRELSIAPNGTRQAVFTESFDEPGTYELYVNDHFAGNVTVNQSETTTDAPLPDVEPAPGTP